MSKIIPFQELTRLQHLNFLERLQRQYQDTEGQLQRLRKLLFQLEGRLRQTEIQQLHLFQQAAQHFGLAGQFPGLQDQLQLQQAFANNPFLRTLQDFFTGRLTGAECYQRLLPLLNNSTRESQDNNS